MSINNFPNEYDYLTDFEDFILSEIPIKEEVLGQNFNDDHKCRSTQENVNLDEEANDFIDRPTSSNIFYPNIDSFDETFFKICNVPGFKMNLRNSLESQLDLTSKMDVFHTMPIVPINNRSQSVDLFEDYSETKSLCVSPDIFSDLNEDEREDVFQNNIEPVESVKKKTKQDLIADIEKFIINLLQDLVNFRNTKITVVNCAKWENCEMFNGILTLKESSNLIYRSTDLKNLKSRHHFAMIMYVLSEVYHLLITNTTCTERELYYDDPELAESQSNIRSAIKDVCNVLKVSPWELGILSSTKGLIAGAVKIHISNHLIIDCYMYDGATLIPADMEAISLIETTAKFVLIIEKDTIFEKLLRQNILLNLNRDVILITGKGFPDLSTRLMVKRLWNDFRLPIYVLVDADPFGIEIMFVFRFGSRAMVLNSDQLACPQIRWIGIQPSEIDMLAIPTVPQSKKDKKKITELLQRSYVSGEIRNELEILQRLDYKAEIEGVASFSANFLVSDYIPNKIKRNLVI